MSASLKSIVTLPEEDDVSAGDAEATAAADAVSGPGTGVACAAIGTRPSDTVNSKGTVDLKIERVTCWTCLLPYIKGCSSPSR